MKKFSLYKSTQCLRAMTNPQLNLSFLCSLYNVHCLASYTNYLFVNDTLACLAAGENIRLEKMQILFFCYLTAVGHLFMTKNIKRSCINYSTNNAKYLKRKHLI